MEPEELENFDIYDIQELLSDGVSETPELRSCGGYLTGAMQIEFLKLMRQRPDLYGYPGEDGLDETTRVARMVEHFVRDTFEGADASVSREAAEEMAIRYNEMVHQPWHGEENEPQGENEESEEESENRIDDEEEGDGEDDVDIDEEENEHDEGVGENEEGVDEVRGLAGIDDNSGNDEDIETEVIYD